MLHSIEQGRYTIVNCNLITTNGIYDNMVRYYFTIWTIQCPILIKCVSHIGKLNWFSHMQKLTMIWEQFSNIKSQNTDLTILYATWSTRTTLVITIFNYRCPYVNAHFSNSSKAKQWQVNSANTRVQYSFKVTSCISISLKTSDNFYQSLIAGRILNVNFNLSWVCFEKNAVSKQPASNCGKIISLEQLAWRTTFTLSLSCRVEVLHLYHNMPPMTNRQMQV